MADDLRVPLGPMFAAFGVPVTVTRPAPDDTPIVTTGIWVNQDLDAPVGGDVPMRRRELRRVLSLDRSVVPTAPRGTLIAAAEVLDGETLTWRADGLADTDVDVIRVVVVPVETET